MAENKMTIEKSRSDDFRRMETHVEENVQGAATERVTTYKEEVIPMAVRKVVRETIVPVVTSRKIESYENGKVVGLAHEVVEDHALTLNPHENKFTQEEIIRLVDEVLRRHLGTQTQQIIPPSPAPVPSPTPAPSPAPGFSFGFDGTLLLYAVVAIEAAATLYLTVLKGWVLN